MTIARLVAIWWVESKKPENTVSTFWTFAEQKLRFKKVTSPQGHLTSNSDIRFARHSIDY